MLVVLTAFVTFMITAFSMYSYFNNTSIVSVFESLSSQNSENSNKSTDLEKYMKNRVFGHNLSFWGVLKIRNMCYVSIKVAEIFSIYTIVSYLDIFRKT